MPDTETTEAPTTDPNGDIIKAERLRRGAKGAFTRLETKYFSYLHANRAESEIRKCHQDLCASYQKVEKAHDEYCLLLEDEDFEREQGWIEEMQDSFIKADCSFADFLKKSEQSVTPQKDASDPDPDKGTKTKKKHLRVKAQKVDKPSFSGKILDFFEFLDDFEFIYGDEEEYTKEEALYCLKHSVPESAKKWLINIRDYDEAVKVLSELYGEPKRVSDSFINEILKFKSVQSISQFEDLYHLIQRAKNILNRKEIKKNSDLDNSTTLAQIESKMETKDRERWARYQLEHKIDPSLSELLNFMKIEIDVKRRAGEPIRTEGVKVSEAKSLSGKGMLAQNGVKPKQNLPQPTNPPPLNLPQPTGSKPKPCWVCTSDDLHSPTECPKFQAMTPDKRLQLTKEKRICWFCLKFHRFNQPCRGRKQCDHTDSGTRCKYFHHSMLHGANFVKATTPDPTQNSANSGSAQTAGPCAVSVSDNEGLSPVINVDIVNPVDSEFVKPVCTFIDNGATLSLIKMDTANSLQLPSEPITVSLGKVGGSKDLLRTKLFTLLVRPISKEKTVYKIKAIGISEICGEIPHVDIEVFSKLFNIDTANFHRGDGFPELLIGTDYVKFHAGKIEVRETVAIRHSILGPIIFGVKSEKENLNSDRDFGECDGTIAISHVEPVDLTKFFEAENLNIALNPCCTRKYGNKLLPLNEKLEEQFIRNRAIYIKEEQRWMIPIPYEKDPSLLPNNDRQIESCLYSLEKQLLSKEPKLAKGYDEQIMDLVARGSARKLGEDEIRNYGGPVWYLNHHPIYKHSSTTTPIRPVFNSAKVFKGHSLNDYQMKGPDLLNDQTKILLRFRDFPVAIMGDVKKMYHQVRTRPAYDGNLHRFLWRNFDTSRRPDVYKFLVLSFGDKCSPALAMIAMNLTAEQFVEEYPDAVDTIINSRYMDDIIDSLPDIAATSDRIQKIDSILKTGHFEIKHWISNRDLVPVVPGTRIKPVDGSEEKVLGVGWNVEDDTLHIVSKYPPKALLQAKQPDILTKRMVLSVIAEVYDVTGVAGPFLLQAKIQLQKIWKLGFGWDENLPEDMKHFWTEFLAELRIIGTVNFPRSLTPDNVIGEPNLIVFCDASNVGYGSVAFARWQTSSGHFVCRFICSKNRVSPLKTLSIPQLELNSCVIGARLHDSILNDSRLQFEKYILFTDSMISLAWIQSESRNLKPFIAVRVGEIHMRTDKNDWRHIPSQYNVADDLTRGLHLEELDGRWTHGDPFLARPEEEWPEQTMKLNQDDDEMLKQSILNDAAVAVSQTTPTSDEFIRKFSSLPKTIRVTAYVKRFLQNFILKLKGKKRVQYNRDISVTEYNDALKTLVIVSQENLDIKNLKSLSPGYENGILVVKGRTDNLVAYENYRPPILPNGAHLSYLIVSHYHHKRGHDTPAALAAKVRRDFWIVGVNRSAKSVYGKCVFCREWNAKTELQVMADLPVERLLPFSPPWTNTSIDFFGPIKVRFGRNKTTKAYGVVFCCLVVRCVYIDVAEDYSTEKFHEVLRRFYARCGQPEKLWSDRGSQLVACDNELRRMVQGFVSQELKEFGHERQVQWQFFTPTAAHHNGITEAMVKIAKKKLKQVLDGKTLSIMELQTFCFEVAQLMNQRPIGRLPNHPEDGHYLSPNDLLLGRASASIPQGPFFETTNAQHRFEYIENIVKQWWKLWYRDVFPHLVPRKKWHNSQRNVTVNDYVLVKEQNPIRGHYTRGRVTAVFPGRDGRVRSVRVKTTDGEYERPITSIVVLMATDGDDE